MNTNMTNQAQVRMAFWERSEFSRKYNKRNSEGDYHVDVRCAFVDFVDALARDGQITESLAQRVTL